MARLQMGQNAAARLLTSYSTMTRVTPVISYLQYIGSALGFLLRALVLTCRRPLARSAMRAPPGTVSAASPQWSALRAREPRVAALTVWLSYTNSF